MNLLYHAKRVSLLCLALLAFGCKKGEDNPTVPEEKGHFKVTFVKTSTKAFFDGLVRGEECERKLQNATLFIFENTTPASNTLVGYHNFSEYELGIKTGELETPTAVISIAADIFDVTKTYDFYVLANHVLDQTTIEGMTRTALEELKYEDVESYNYTTSTATSGTFTDIFPESGDAVALRVVKTGKNGFAMSGTKTNVSPTADENTPRKVSVEISRNVAKVEAKAWTTAAFNTNYYLPFKSTLTIESVELENVSKECLAIEPATFTAPTNYVKLKQTPKVVADGSEDAGKETNNDKKAYYNVFYLFENGLTGGTPANGKEVKLVVKAKYDFDGDPLTTNDISDIVYEKKLEGVDQNKKGLIMRNSFIQLTIKISGLTSKEIVADFEIKDWAAVVSQEIEFGS